MNVALRVCPPAVFLLFALPAFAQQAVTLQEGAGVTVQI